MAFNIIKKKTMLDLLKALSNMYEKPSAMNKMYLMWRLFNHKFEDDNDSIYPAKDTEDANHCVDNPIESWILDSGASFHSSPNQELFQIFKSGNFEKVYLADHKTMEIEGK